MQNQAKDDIKEIEKSLLLYQQIADMARPIVIVIVGFVQLPHRFNLGGMEGHPVVSQASHICVRIANDHTIVTCSGKVSTQRLRILLGRALVHRQSRCHKSRVAVILHWLLNVDPADLHTRLDACVARFGEGVSGFSGGSEPKAHGTTQPTLARKAFEIRIGSAVIHRGLALAVRKRTSWLRRFYQSHPPSEVIFHGVFSFVWEGTAKPDR